MRLRFCAFFLSLLFSVCLIAFFGRSYNSAALTGGSYLTAADARALFGDTISVRYYKNDGNGGAFADTVAHYYGTGNVSSIYSDTSFESVYSGAPFLLYEFNSTSISADINYITVRVNPSYSIIDTNVLHTFIACSYFNSSYNISTTFTSPSWNWSNGHFENNSTDSSGHHAYFVGSTGSACYTYVPVDFSSSSSFSCYCLDANFYGNRDGGYQRLYIAVGIPYISSSASVHPGTDSSGSGSGSSGTTVNINVDVDMEETNGLLEGIHSTLSGIVNGIKNLFIPSAESLEVFEENMKELLEAHLGGLYDAADIISGIWTQFENTSAKQSIIIPQCSIPLAGEDLVLGGWTVPLKVQGMPSILYESLAWIIDFLAVAAFINMCRNKLEIFLNPDSEVVQNDN